MGSIGRAIKDAGDAVIKAATDSRRLKGLADNLVTHVDDVKAKVHKADRNEGNPGPVKEFEVGPYRGLQRRETTGDGMQHDHIPSSAAIRRARENELGRRLDPDERRALHNDATAVELSDLLHSLSRTFKGRNTQDQIDLDASDLRAAMERDLRTLRTNLTNDGRLSSDEIANVLQEIRDLNLKRGIG